ncbi:TonB-dependent receptor [Anatilimnocola sp. NA78]|uniref:TonB-dependent receptor n=1 Tax=Anatilimnocola sp. NA78 TaxID=3415683 RepID=UPI003CE56188
MRISSLFWRHESVSQAPWYLSLAALGLLGWSSLGGLPRASAQEAQPPTLPATEVEAVQPTLPPTNVEGFEPNLIDPNGGYDPVLDGTPFSSVIDPGYRQSESTTGSLIPLLDSANPATVNVISRDLLNDQIALNINDVLRNAGGVTPGQGDGVFKDRFLIRGFELGSRDFRRDGFLDPTYVPRDFQSIERVEVLKGPAGSIWGSGSPAGVVNLVTKKPLDATFSDVGFTFGSYQQARFTLDTNGRASSDGSVLYRVNVAQEDSKGFVDFDHLNRTLIAPTVSWQIDDYARITYSAEYHKHSTIGFQGTPVVNGDPLFLPPNRYVGEPANDFFQPEEFRQSLVLEQELNDDWSLRVGGYSLFYSYPLSTTAASGTPTGAPPVPEPFFYRSRSVFEESGENSQSFQANLVGDTFIGNLRHRIVTGVEYIYFGSETNFYSDGIQPIDVTNPVYLNPPEFGAQFRQDSPLFQHQRVGWYLQDYVDITDQIKLLGGLRVESLNLRYDRVNTFAGFPVGGGMTDQDYVYTSPRAGAIYQPFADESLAFYCSYGQTFAPPSGGIYVNPGPLRPVTGESIEGGVKSLLLENLQLNVAGWYATRNNADLNNRAFFLTQIGQETSRGAEVNLIGQITDYWSAVANYTYTDVRIDDPAPPAAFDGNRQRGVPYNSANFWTRYNLIQDDSQAFGVALGLVYSDSRPGDLANTFVLPSYGRWDGGLFYERGQLRTNVYLENLFDIQYATSSVDQYTVFQGAPFNVRANVTYSF